MSVSYRHILVPLDGSPFAEVALAHALVLARACSAEVTLLNSVSPMDEVMVSEGEPVFLADLWKARQQAAQTYLESVGSAPSGAKSRRTWSWRKPRRRRHRGTCAQAQAI